MRRISLSERMILNYVGVSLAAIALVGGVIFYIARNALVDRTYNQLTSVRMAKTMQIELFFSDRLRDARMASGSDDVAHILAILENSSGDEFRNNSINADVLAYSKSSHIYQYLLSSHYYDSFIIGEKGGNFIEIRTVGKDSLTTVHFFSNSDLSQQLGSYKNEILDFMQDPVSKEEVIRACSPVFNKKGNPLGFIAFGISPLTIDAIMLERDPSKGLGNTGESYLVGDDGFLRSNSRFSSHSILKTTVNTNGVKRAVSGSSGTGIYKDYRGVSVLGSYGKVNIPGLSWVILAEIDLPEAMKIVTSLRNNILVLTLIIAIAVFCLTFLIARRITRPLIRLKRAALEIGKGQFARVELPHSNDEIHDLTEAFNQMAEELEAKRSELAAERIQRFSAVIDGQEIERQRLSMELHDGLGQSLIALKLRLESISDTEDPRAAKTLMEVSRGVDLTIEEIRRMSNDLMPAILKEFGLETAIRNICEETSINGKLDMDFQGHCIPRQADQRVQTYLYRVTQEALHNIIRHAAASKARVLLECKNQKLILEIEDNGDQLKIEQLAQSKGNGLYNIRERVNLLSGNLTFTKGKMNGMLIHIEVPIKIVKDGKD